MRHQLRADEAPPATPGGARSACSQRVPLGELRDTSSCRKADGQDDFEKMLKEEKLDVLVVTTVDSEHDLYIVPALYAGIRVLTEKPMTMCVQLAYRVCTADEKERREMSEDLERCQGDQRIFAG